METSHAAPAGTRRLIIREMVLENFKSYAGEQRVGPFHKCFSSVVGPNGSGKSNVIDALLFVFGRRAKQLRFNKVSELIHNSTNHQNLQQAKVSVYFQEILDQEGEEYQVIPNSQFVVARTANKNNTSDYYVQNKKVSAKEVADLLKGKGIDLDNNRFLILQGEVEQISLMKPKGEEKGDVGLLEYLEDLIGTDKYVEPIEEAAKRLEQMNEQRHVMIQRLKAAERERDKLEGAKVEAESYLSKQAEALHNRLNGNRLYMQQSKNHIELYQTKLTELQGKHEQQKTKKVAFEAESKSSEKDLKAAEKEHQRIQKALTDADTEWKELEKRDNVYHEDLKHLEQRIKKATSKLEADTKALKKLETETAAMLAEAPADRQRAEQLAAELQKQEQKLEAMTEEIKEEVEGLRQQLQAAKAELAPWDKQMQEAQSAVDVAASEKQLLAGRQADAQKRLEAAHAGLAEAKNGAQERSKAIAKLEAKAGSTQQAIQEAREQLEARRADEAAAEESVRQLRGKVEALRVDVNSQQSASGIVRALMAAKASGSIPGIFGRLGDLAAIDAQYDVAVSTACGALDYILVETTADAQRCVELLRVQGLGVATFLILEKQMHLQQAASQKPQTPEGVPRLFDLVRISDPRLRPAFYFAMGNTTVAKDLEQATRIAYGGDQRFSRVVTLQGELISESGAMSGGGGKPRGGRMALGTAAPRSVDAKAAATELAKTEKELDQAVKALQEARQAVTAAQSALTTAERALAALEVELPKARMEAAAQTTRAQDLQARLAELEAATQVGAEEAQRLQELQAEIDASTKKLQQLQKSASGLQAKAAALEKQVEAAGGEPLKRQKVRVASMREEVAGLEAGATKKEVQARTNQKQVDKISKEMAKQDAERQKHQADMERIQGEVAAMEDTAVVVLQRVQAAQAELEEHKEQLTAMQAERDRRMTELGIIKDTVATIEAAMEKLKAETKAEKTNITKWTRLVEEGEAELSQMGCDIPMLDEADLAGSEDQLKERIDQHFYKVGIIEQEMAAMSPDMAAIQEWRKKDEDCTAKRNELEAATQERNLVARSHEELRKKRLDEFMAGFNNITLRLKELYQCITLGGDAELELVDSLDPFSEGIVFSVRPPKKSWKNIGHLSGGEKTLSSLALVFALHGYKPTPLYVMDEIDAALDFKNVSIVGHYIKERTKDAQFIIISLRNNMFELADRLVGIYKTDNATKTVTITPAAFVVGATEGPAQTTGTPQHHELHQQQQWGQTSQTATAAV